MKATLDLPRELARLGDADPRTLPASRQAALLDAGLRWLGQDAQKNQLAWYQPVNDDARRLHLSCAREIGIQGGNKSGKTGTTLAEVAIQMTGIVPDSLVGVYPAAKIRPPIRARLGVTSLTSAWDTNLKHKLQWFHWNGKLNEDRQPGDPRHGHWGWIPQRFLLNGDWNQSWSEKHRTLTLNLRGDYGVEPGSTLVIMSYDQALSEWNQGSYHLIGEDEIPPEEIHRANKLRVIELGGQVITGGTPPDDRSGAVTAAWFYDQVLTPGLSGSNPDESFAIAIWTEHNRTLSESDVAWVAKGLTAEQRRARLHGEAIHLEGLIFPGVKELPATWCFRCVQAVYPLDGRCPECLSADLVSYCHAWDDDEMDWPGPRAWPTLFYMDPHQAKPTACAWYKIDPTDGWWQIHELEVSGDASAVRREVEAFEHEHQLGVLWRKGDPKITAQRNQFAREVDGQMFTIREAFLEAGFPFEEANTNFTVARERVLHALQPMPVTRTPRLRIYRGCPKTLYQMTHFTWKPEGRAIGGSRDGDPSRINSDFPALVRYLAMDDPTWPQCMQMLQPPMPRRSRGEGRGVTGW